jgi:hypothetical protein
VGSAPRCCWASRRAPGFGVGDDGLRRNGPRPPLDRGLRLVATDLDRAWGAGDPLEGRGVDLLMAACGRTALLPALTGAGVPVLAGRLTRRT